MSTCMRDCVEPCETFVPETTTCVTQEACEGGILYGWQVCTTQPSGETTTSPRAAHGLC
ncbi:hypothetical protein [Streptomyces litchfieldiae]|uniref:Uncharacterized protein n=1 Tax=Streptomyces litchfieldiae TaxID=3075543 RepID=A0ABU2MSG6_9ACTN|nr:hypothetical protein [Streptomyces sp. DSM 44938]MDT0344583.1 hypothetical protein [Streptomyces sp. DSM 44938]